MPEERSELWWLEHGDRHSGTGGGYYPDDCGECGSCGSPSLGGGLCSLCRARHQELVNKADTADASYQRLVSVSHQYFSEMLRKRLYVKSLVVDDVVYKKGKPYRVEQCFNGKVAYMRNLQNNYLCLWGIFDFPDYQFDGTQVKKGE